MGATGGDAQAREALGRATEAINLHFPQFDARDQAWMLAFVPTDQASAAAIPAVHHAAKRSPSARVRVIYLLRFVTDPNSPDISAALRGDDASVRDFAKAHEAGLARAEAARRAAQTPSPETPVPPVPP